MSNGSRLCSCQGRPLRPGYDQLSCLRHRGKRRPKKWPKSGHLVDNNTVAEFWKKARVKAITRPYSPAQCCPGTWLEKSKQEGYSWRFAKAKQKAIIITIKGSFLFLKREWKPVLCEIKSCGAVEIKCCWMPTATGRTTWPSSPVSSTHTCKGLYLAFNAYSSALIAHY